MEDKKKKLPKEPPSVRRERLQFVRRLAGSVVKRKTDYQRHFKNQRAGDNAGSFSFLDVLRGAAASAMVVYLVWYTAGAEWGTTLSRYH